MNQNYDLDQIWKTALGELEVVLSQANFSTWFRDTFILEFNNGDLVIAVPNAFNRDWIRDKYHKEVSSTLRKFIPATKEVIYKITSDKPATPRIVIEQAPPPQSPKTDNKRLSNTLSPQYMFNNFIVGNTNRFAAASAQAVVDKPGSLHNPLFIYGGVGLGKTHLAQAIGNEILARDANKKVVYATCETFTNDFVIGISSGKMKEFKKNYRDVDVLIIDDIQFLSNKEGSQEEFFHTYNTLHQTNRQIVITADKPPKSITALEERLRSRFGSGLMVDIQPPNLETRLAIIHAKTKELKIPFPDDVAMYIAENVRSNVRELTGAINKVATHAQLYNEEPTVNLCDELLKDIFTTKTGNVSVDKIITAICKFYNLAIGDVLSKKRQKDLVQARQIAMYLLRYELNLSYPLIGIELGGRDHTTIIYGSDKIERDIVKNSALKSDLISIREIIHNS